jgi:hypothetical protein
MKTVDTAKKFQDWSRWALSAAERQFQADPQQAVSRTAPVKGTKPTLDRAGGKAIHALPKSVISCAIDTEFVSGLTASANRSISRSVFS